MAHRMLLLALDAGLRWAMGREGRRHVRDRFELTQQVGKLESVILHAGEGHVAAAH